MKPVRQASRLQPVRGRSSHWGDEELFASPGFRAWLPEEPKLVYRRLGEVMELG
ncbi:MAG TPA: hypothetical protein VHQ65_08000 [Thermoanaerobaculia bacterium]|nr:hypothetical protein [Thermoanaerobaculia bacterium]